jgi:hypothetical protein
VVPESVEANATRIWRIGQDGTLTEVAIVAPGNPLADPTLFTWQGKFWLGATRIAIGPLDNLCLYYADRLEGPWHAHIANPVKIDITSARSAGAPFLHAGKLMRPAQDCAASYGSAIVLNEIEELTTTCFSERPVRRLTPDCNGPFPDGLHTISAFGHHTLIDGKRLVARPHDLLQRLIARASPGRAFKYARTFYAPSHATPIDRIPSTRLTAGRRGKGDIDLSG